MHTCFVDFRGRRRPGLTLVELLVVTAIILALAAITVLFAPKMMNRQRSDKGAEQIQGVLLIARQRAARDGAPRGVRLQPVPITTSLLTQITPAMIASQFSTTPPKPLTVNVGAVVGVTDRGMPWGIQQNYIVLVYDQVITPGGGTQIFTNLEPIQVLNVTATPAATITAFFNQTHAGAPTSVVKVLRYVQDLQYIESPGDTFTQGTPSIAAVSATNPNGTQIDFTFPAGIDLYGGASNPLGAADPTRWAVQPGDYIQIQDGRAVARHLIARISSATQLQVQAFTPPGVSPPPPTLVMPTQQPNSFVVYRETPRISPGEAAIQLPEDVAIDLHLSFAYSRPLPIDPNTGVIDLLFSPTGQLVGRNTGTDKVILWLRDVTQDAGANNINNIFPDPQDPAANLGGQSLISIYVRTGMIGAHQVNPDKSLGDPFYFTKSNRTSGL